MKLSVLELTQSILSSLNSDEVNSISDTVESQQVAEIVRSSYFNLMNRFNMPEHNQLFQLTASGSIDQPVLMLRPDGVTTIDCIEYLDNNPDTADPSMYKEVKIYSTRDFLTMTDSFNTNESNIDTFTLTFPNVATDTDNTFTFRFKTDKQPQYCTILQNYYVVFDSFDSDVDGTLQSTKTRCYGWLTPRFDLEDDFVPDLDDQQFPILLNEAKALAFLELKQQPHQKAEMEVRRQSSSIQKNKAIVNRPNYFDSLPNFGRTGSRSGRPRMH